MWQPHEPYHHPRYDPVWAACEELSMPGARPLRRRRPGVVRPARRHLHDRGPVLVVAAAVVPDLVGRVRAVPAPAVRRGRVRRVLGQRPALADGPRLRARPRLAQARRAAHRQHVDAAERVLRPQLLHRRVEHAAARAGPSLRDRRRQPLLGQRLPAPRGHLAPHKEFLREAFCDIPRDETAAILGLNAAEVYGFDTDALAPLADRIGPTPEDLGQSDDPTAKWAALKRAGRPWLTGIETGPPPALA